MNTVIGLSLEQRLESVLTKTLPKLAPEIRAQLAAVINARSLAIMGAVLTAWIGAHAIGLGEIIDVVIAVAGFAAIGFAFFSGVDELYEFAAGVYQARSDIQLDSAADHLAKAIGILGIQTVLAILFRGAKLPRTGAGGRLNVGTPPPRTSGWRYKPAIKKDPTLAAGDGFTTFWGDITVSSQGPATEQALVLIHEKVHQFLMPKLYLLRTYRISNRAGSYVRSSLWRYLEEALAETIAQIGVFGLKQLHIGIRFPVANGYVYLTRAGGQMSSRHAGHGLLPETAALIHQCLVSGVAFSIYFRPGHSANLPEQKAATH